MWHLFSISPSPLTILAGAASGLTMALPFLYLSRAIIEATPDPAYEIRLLSGGLLLYPQQNNGRKHQ
jgi:hypothetical protein